MIYYYHHHDYCCYYYYYDDGDSEEEEEHEDIDAGHGFFRATMIFTPAISTWIDLFVQLKASKSNRQKEQKGWTGQF